MGKRIYLVLASLMALLSIELVLINKTITSIDDGMNDYCQMHDDDGVVVYDKQDDTNVGIEQDIADDDGENAVSYDVSYELYDVSYELYDAPENSGFKSFMDYRMITDVSSRQYMLQHNYARTDDHGIRMVGDRYCVALGSYFTSEIGQCFDLVLENGVVIPCIMADQKDDADTNETNAITMHNGCMSEFVVDFVSLDGNAKLHGDMSYCSDEWNSPISSVKIYNNNVFDFD